MWKLLNEFRSAVTVDLGPVGEFRDLPKLVEIHDAFYYVVRPGRTWKVLSTLCPHQGGEVVWRESEGEFVCPLHGWRFDRDGSMEGCPGLKSYRVTERDGRLTAILK